MIFRRSICLAAAMSILFCTTSLRAGELPGLIPQPVKAVQKQGSFTVTKNTAIVFQDNSDCRELASYINAYTGAWFGSPLRVKQGVEYAPDAFWDNCITLSVDTLMKHPSGVLTKMPAEGYILTVTPHEVKITGVDRSGLFNGIQTFFQLLPEEIYARKTSTKILKTLCAEIVDWPRFAYRGFSLDVARSFIPADEVKRFIERMSYHKLNRLHWHLADDEGWRVEIKSHPEIAQKAGFRGNNLPVKPIYGAWDIEYGGYYTQDEIREIVTFAAMRNIEIIPEIDLPGHSRAIARVHPAILCTPNHDNSASAGYDRRNVWCASKESNYKLLEDILTEVCTLFPSKYIHVGGDEVEKPQWLTCPSCRKLAKGTDITPVLVHFTERLVKILAANGKRTAVWNEVASGGTLNKNTRVHAWESIDAAKEATMKGYPTVVMPGNYFYFDMRQSAWEYGQVWAGVVDTYRNYSFDFQKLGFTEAQMTNVEGVEAAFFGELLIPGGGIDYLYYQTYPRICSLSELGWTPQRQRDTRDFHGRLYGTHTGRLTAMGIGYRLPPPMADFAGGKITVDTQSEHFSIRYTDDGSQPIRTSPRYHRPIYRTNMEGMYFETFIGENHSIAIPAGIHAQAAVPSNDTLTVSMPLPEDNLSDNALWYLRARSTEPGVVISSMQVIAPDTSYYIIKGGQTINELHLMRYYSTPKSLGGKMVVKVKNGNRLPAQLTFRFERSPYIEPAVTISSTMTQNSKFPFSNLKDYNFTSYARTAATCKKGDYLTYTFAEKVDCHSIEVQTGLYYMPRYHVQEGHVEISADGLTFTRIEDLDGGRVVVYPPYPVKALRVVADMTGNGESAVTFQDLKITPKKQ